MKRVWSDNVERLGPQVVLEDGRYFPTNTTFSECDAQFLRSVGWDPTKVMSSPCAK